MWLRVIWGGAFRTRPTRMSAPVVPVMLKWSRLPTDPIWVSYDDLLNVFWNSHDPTTLNRQGPDRGSQYRSAIFYHDEKQQAAAIASKARWDSSDKFSRPVVTMITPASTFYRAEEYHRSYLEKHGLASCHTR